MVKNKKGGRNHRKQASKHAKPVVQAKIREAVNEDETYALVIKLNGNSMCDVRCSDKVVRLLRIRKKFRGRNRRDNNIGLQTMLLVGLRSWEVRDPKKKQNVDLLYVYSREHVDTLRSNAWARELKHVFPTNQQPEDKEDFGGFEITSSETWEDKLAEEEAAKLENPTIKITVGEEDNKEEFNFEDI